jgi:hypothetical protein
MCAARHRRAGRPAGRLLRAETAGGSGPAGELEGAAQGCGSGVYGCVGVGLGVGGAGCAFVRGAAAVDVAGELTRRRQRGGGNCGKITTWESGYGALSKVATRQGGYSGGSKAGWRGVDGGCAVCLLSFDGVNVLVGDRVLVGVKALVGVGVRSA